MDKSQYMSAKCSSQQEEGLIINYSLQKKMYLECDAISWNMSFLESSPDGMVP